MGAGGVLIGDSSGSFATDRLRETVEKFNEEASRQTRCMIFLTKWIAGLTVALLVGLCIQIWLELRREHPLAAASSPALAPIAASAAPR